MLVTIPLWGGYFYHAMSSKTCKVPFNSYYIAITGGITWEPLVYLPMEGSPCGSPKYTPLQWKSEFFFLSYLFDFFFFSSLLVSTLETLRYLNCQGRGVACSPEYDSQIQKQKQNFKYYVQLDSIFIFAADFIWWIRV